MLPLCRALQESVACCARFLEPVLVLPHGGCPSVSKLNANLPLCLQGLREELVDGNYSLVLEFANKKGMSSEQWEVWRPKFGTFFGPGITAQARGDRRLCFVWPDIAWY